MSGNRLPPWPLASLANIGDYANVGGTRAELAGMRRNPSFGEGQEIEYGKV
jgi:hypothetical protein